MTIEFVLYGYLGATLLAAGATLSQGTRLLLVLGGALLGLLGLPAVQHLTNPLSTNVLGPRTLDAVGSLLFMLIPAWCILDSVHRPRLSVRDGFLTGFLPGFGADCIQALTQPGPLQVTWQLPGGQTLHGYWAGYGWWCGAVTLAWSAAYRFGKDSNLARLWASVVFAWATVDRLSAAHPFAPYSTIQGRGLVLATAVALVYYGLHERYWLRRSVGWRNLMSTPELEVPGVAEVLRQFGPYGLAQRWRALDRRRQILIERQELVDMGRVSIAELPRAFKLDTGGADLGTWALRLVAMAAAVYAFTSPAGYLFEPLLVGLILLNYVRATDLEPDDADPAVRTIAEAILLNGSLCAVLLWYFLRPAAYPIDYAYGAGQSWEIILAFAFLGASWAGSQQRGARAFLRPRHRRLVMLHRALTVLKCAVVCYALVKLYPLASHLAPRPNRWLEFLLALAAGAVAALAAHLLNQLSERIMEKLQQQS